MHWWEIIELAHVQQEDRTNYLRARVGKLTSSDFAATVPKTEEFIGHIIERWGYENFSYAGKGKATTCGKDCYKKYLTKKLASIADGGADTQAAAAPPKSNFAMGNTECNMKRGDMFEPVVRNITAAMHDTSIAACGFVVGRKHPNSGVSPDGIFMATAIDPVSGLYSDTCTRGFEAKTVCGRKMIQKVPLQYHIQCERTCFELGLSSCVYTEAEFVDLLEEDWTQRQSAASPPPTPPTLPYAQYGLMIVREGKFHYPSRFVMHLADLLKWRDSFLRVHAKIGVGETPFVKYYFVKEVWTTEIVPRPDYSAVYGPLIKKEADRLRYLHLDPEGRIETLQSFTAGAAEEPARKRKKTELEFIDYSSLPRYMPDELTNQ